MPKEKRKSEKTLVDEMQEYLTSEINAIILESLRTGIPQEELGLRPMTSTTHDWDDKKEKWVKKKKK